MSKEADAVVKDWMTWHPPTMLAGLERPVMCTILGCHHHFRAVEGLRFEKGRPVVKCPKCDKYVGGLLDGLHWKPGALVCSSCGAEAKTSVMTFRKNIGLILVRLYDERRGAMCRACAGSLYRGWTATTLFLGWWGVISFFTTPYILITNTINYFGNVGAAGNPANVSQRWLLSPQLNEVGLARLEPHTDWVIDALSDQMADRLAIGRDLAKRAGVSPVVALMFMEKVATEQIRAVIEGVPQPAASTASTEHKSPLPPPIPEPKRRTPPPAPPR